MSTNKTADIHIKPGSEITISGKSNVNRFSCHYTTEIAPGCQIISYNYLNKTFVLDNAEIKLKSSNFDCGGRLINKDFNELIQSDEHPNIKIKFTKIEFENDYFKVSTRIEIAEEINDYFFIIYPQHNQHYVGDLEINIEDFDMKAPRKLLGAIKVDPHISINFDLILEID